MIRTDQLKGSFDIISIAIVVSGIVAKVFFEIGYPAVNDFPFLHSKVPGQHSLVRDSKILTCNKYKGVLSSLLLQPPEFLLQEVQSC